ncbi:MAG: AAA family ATPase, partial [Candidatus Thorarchaeota archaeon]
ERHEEYKEVFDRLYFELIKQKPDRILLTGDIVHSKITLSPELVSLTVDFLTNLQNIAPLDMIVGNHDMNMSNTERMDALTPLVEASDKVDSSGFGINYMLDTGFYEIGDISYGVYSLLDGGDIHLRKKDKKDGITYIALYHGVVAGVVLDNDYVFSDSSTSLATFNNFDFVMLGDIHKNQFLNTNKTAAYPGSLIQQNFGEELNHGFLMWDIKSKDDFEVEFIPVHNDYAYATIYADDGILPDMELPSKTRIRVVWSMKASDISRAEASRLNSLIRSKYDPLSVQLTFKPIGQPGIGEVEVDESSNLADPATQEDLLRQWFLNLDDDVEVDKLMDIDRQVSDTVTSSEFEDFSNSRWHIKKITMENFMSYAGPEVIDFDTMRGVIGLFGDNTAGKSVIIDAILYALFNKTTREVKNEDLVNKYTDSDVCRVKAHIVIKGVEYEIDRWTTRQYQKRSGRFMNARTDVTVNRRYNENDEWENLTETTRNDSEKIIRNAIGNFDDFMITTLSTQGGNSEFLKLKPSPRADVMLRFLGLDVFNRKYDYAKDLLKQIEHERRSFNQSGEIELLDTKKSELTKNKRSETTHNKKIKLADEEVERIRNDISKHNNLINTTIKIDKDSDTLEAEREEFEKTIVTLETDHDERSEQQRKLVAKMESLESEYILDEDKLVTLNQARIRADEDKQYIVGNERKVASHMRVLKLYKKDLENENTCPVSYDDEHFGCSYLQGYVTKKNECLEIMDDVAKLNAEIKATKERLAEVEYVYGVLEEQETIREHMEKAVGKLSTIKARLVEIENSLDVKRVSLSLILSQKKIADSNKKTIKNNIQHKGAIVTLEESLTEKLKVRNKLSDNREKISNKVVLLTKEIQDIEDTLENIRNSDEQYSLFNTYCNAMHRTGLPVDVLKSYIPKINYEVNKILSDVVEFGVYLKIDAGETDINIVMRYDGEGDDTRPASMSSG